MFFVLPEFAHARNKIIIEGMMLSPAIVEIVQEPPEKGNPEFGGREFGPLGGISLEIIVPAPYE